MSNTEQSNKFGFSVATARPTLRERQLALAVVGMILVGSAALVPFADIPLVRLDSFIPSIQIIVSITSIIGAVLLFGQFSTLGLHALLVLASGYLFVALIVISHILTFPGAFTLTGLLGAGPQTAAWLYFFWHFGFPIAVIGFALLKETKGPVRYSTGSVIVWTVTATVGLVCLLTWIVTAQEQLLPVLFTDGTRFSPFTTYVTGTDLFLSALALALLWKRSRSILDMWLCVTLCAFLAELVINTVLISGRFTVGWYAGRGFSVLVPAIVMILMLAQTFALNATLIHLTMMLQRERSNKLANLEAVVASIAHEVRQPLAGIAIRGAAAQRYLNRVPPNLREAGRCIAAMVDASMRANEIFENVRTLFSTSVDQPRQPVDVNQLIAEALGLLREELDAHRIEIRMKQTPQLPSIMAHNGQLREVMLNLIQNAIDAMKEFSDRRRVLEIRTVHHDNEDVIISVQDSGPGIEPEKLKSIFDPFFSTKAKGMGLGLAICKSIVERHHGQLSASSEIGGGARFDLIFPIKPAAQRESSGELVDMLQIPVIPSTHKS
jgi:signal transduction histidine kinase